MQTFKKASTRVSRRSFYHCLGVATVYSLLVLQGAGAQSIRFPWSGYGHESQHDAIAPVASQPLNHILWHTPVDLDPQYSGSELLIHYGSPLVTRSNTVIVPVKTGAAGRLTRPRARLPPTTARNLQCWIAATTGCKSPTVPEESAGSNTGRWKFCPAVEIKTAVPLVLAQPTFRC